MRLVSLNAWGGRRFDSLIQFVEQQRDADILCFQEVFSNSAGVEVHREYRADLFGDLKQALPGFVAEHVPIRTGFGIDHKPVDYDLAFGTAVFVRSVLNPSFSSELILKRKSSHHSYHNDKYLQLATIHGASNPLTVATIHGLWIPDLGKVDTDERIAQSEGILKRLEQEPSEHILCGDLNLNPDTESLRMLQERYRNLISEYGIETTRSRFYAKSEKFADYTLVSSGITVNSFDVPYVEASDHLPMILDFDLASA